MAMFRGKSGWIDVALRFQTLDEVIIELKVNGQIRKFLSICEIDDSKRKSHCMVGALLIGLH
jgi:hypothetical protein